MRSRKASAAVAGLKPGVRLRRESRLSLTANSGLVGCLGSSVVDDDRGYNPGMLPQQIPDRPRRPRCLLRIRCSVCWSGAPRASGEFVSGCRPGADPALGALAGCCEARLLVPDSCLLHVAFGGPPLRIPPKAPAVPVGPGMGAGRSSRAAGGAQITAAMGVMERVEAA